MRGKRFSRLNVAREPFRIYRGPSADLEDIIYHLRLLALRSDARGLKTHWVDFPKKNLYNINSDRAYNITEYRL